MRQPLNPHVVSLNNVLTRAVWGVVWTLLFRPSPRPFHAWRAFLLRLFGARIGKRVRVYQTARVWAPWNLMMEDESCLGDYVDCYCVDKVVLEVGSVVSQYSYLCTASHDYSDLGLPLIRAPIVIGARAWVTADVFIAPGVSVGEGAVVLARSSVFNDLPPWTIARGNPAIPVGPRRLKGASYEHTA